MNLSQRLAPATDATVRWCVITLGLSIPISIALDNVLLGVMLLAWIAGARYRAKLQPAYQNPVYGAALLLFAVLAIGTLYGTAPRSDALHYLSKYIDLALVFILGWGFARADDRERGLRMLAVGLAAMLLVSCAIKFHLLPNNPWIEDTTGTNAPLAFKRRVTHNIMMAFAAFFFAWLAFTRSDIRARVGWGLLAVLAIANATLMVEGATGYAVLLVLGFLFAWQRARLRGVATAGATAIAVVAILLLTPNPFQTRVHKIISEYGQADVNRPAASSTAYRLEFYRNTLALIEKHPVAGTGTGSFPSEYARLVAGTGLQASHNPHNEYMLITVQTGVIGLAAFLWLLWVQWRRAPDLPTPLERGLAQGLVLTMALICMLNSALLDHTEGLFFAWLTALLYAGLQKPAARV